METHVHSSTRPLHICWWRCVILRVRAWRTSVLVCVWTSVLVCMDVVPLVTDGSSLPPSFISQVRFLHSLFTLKLTTNHPPPPPTHTLTHPHTHTHT